MLAMADRQGRVWASIPGLANRARVPIEDARTAIATLLAPDRDSRTPDNEGRRIEPIDGGWRLLNYLKYREMRDHEDRLEYQRKWDRENRNRSDNNPNKSDTSDKSRPQPTKAEAEAEKSNPLFERFWTAYPRKQAKQDSLKAFLKLKLENGDFDRVLSALEVAKKSDQWRRDQGKFIPQACRWLNGRLFEDEPPPVAEPKLSI